MHHTDVLKRYKVENDEKWRDWSKSAPWLQFPPELEVKIIPPFGGAMARFMVRFANSTDADRHVSVYWDVFDNLGYMDRPYWEIYPVKYRSEEADYVNNARFLVGEEPQMMVAIIKSLMGEYQ